MAHGYTAQSGFACGVVTDHTEELLERTAARLDVAGQNVALGGPVALSDGQRREFVPKKKKATEPRE